MTCQYLMSGAVPYCVASARCVYCERDSLQSALSHEKQEHEKTRREVEELARKSIEDHAEYKRRRNEQFAAYEELQIRLAAAEAANKAIEVLDRAEINGHIDIAEQCRDYLNHETMDSGDPSGKLQDFANSLRVVVDELDRSHRRRNWYEVAYEAGKEKLIESRIAKALEPIRHAAIAYAHQVNQLGLAADDNDPKVMATAGPIGEAQAVLYQALGIYEERRPCGFGVDGGDCYACELGATNPEGGG